MSVDRKLEKLLTTKDICELLSITKPYLYYLTHSKMIPHFKINGHLRFRQSHIEKWLESQEVRTNVSLQEDFEERN